MKRIFLFLAAVLSFSSESRGQVLSTVRALDAAKDDWAAGKYQKAYDRLKFLRTQPYGRTVPGDYMLGTAACKIGRSDEGRARLLLAAQNYQLSRKSKALFQEGAAKCVSYASASVPLPGPPTHSGGHGKSYFWVDRRVPVDNSAARSIRNLTMAEIEARLSSRSAPPSAAMLAQLGNCRSQRGEAIVLCSLGNKMSVRRQRTLVAQADAFLSFLERDLGIGRADEYVTLRTVKGLPRLRAVARDVHGLEISPATIAYSFQDDLSATAATGGQSGSVLHELAHLATRRDFGDAPQWLEEGLASLYEVSWNCGGTFIARDNWRGNLLRRQWPAEPTITEIVRGNLAIGEAAEPAEAADIKRRAHAEAKIRYLMMYLDQHDSLRALFASMRQISDEEAGAAAYASSLQSVSGRTLEELEAAVKALVFSYGGRKQTNAVGRGCQSIEKKIPTGPS